jgi:DNA polymerase-3 subunit epsilon
VVRDEVAAMSRRIQDVAQHTTQTLKTRWPLEDMRGDDLVQAAARRIEQLYGCRTASSDVDTQLWLKVDSFSLLQALAYLAGRLVDEYGSSWSNCACRCRASAPSSTWCGSARR